MRAVTNLRSRPGRPRWQLTTRPSTAVLLGLASLTAAGVQVALFSSPPPWYQLGVAGFWALVGLAFLGSALGTRARARRSAAQAAARPPVDAVPFVPVPVRPARPRRRDDDEARTGHVPAGATSRARDLPAEVGEPTDPVVTAEATTRLRRPSPTPRRSAGSADATTSRHAVRAVALAESASVSGEAAARATERPHLTAETVAIRDGRAVPRPDRTPRHDDAPRPPRPAATPAATPAPSSAVAPSSAAGPVPAATPELPDGAVPRPRRAPEDRPRPPSPAASDEPRARRRPSPTPAHPAAPSTAQDTPTPTPRPAGRPGSGRRRLEEGPAGAPRALSGTSRHTATTARGRRAEADGPSPAGTRTAADASPATDRGRPEARSAAPVARPYVPRDDDATPPFGGGMTFGAHAKAARAEASRAEASRPEASRAGASRPGATREPSAPAPREPVAPRPTTPPAAPGRHAAHAGGDQPVPARHAARR